MKAHDELGIELALRQAGGDFSTKYQLMKSRLLDVEYEHWAAGFPEGNSHGRSHIQRVLAYLDLMLGKVPLQHLSVYELFLTMMSILYHDVGILRARKGHPDISKQLLEDDQNDAYVINKIDKEIIAAAVVSHSSSKDIAKECARFSPEELVGKHRARPAVVAALVRLADEMDEDYRRADPILQMKLGPPASSEFFWRFCQRVRGVRPNLVAKRIDFNMAFEPDDTTYCGALPGGATRHFVAFSAEKLSKINSERVLVNRFLPPELQYGGLHVDVKPLAGHAKWSAPRTFVFNDKTSAEMFLGSFPELLAEPALLMLHDVLGLMKDGKLFEADKRLDALLGWGDDLPVDVKIKALYETLCVASLGALKACRNASVCEPWLDRGVSAAREWLDVGNAGAFQASGRTADAELHRLVHDPDCQFLLKERLQQLPLLVRSAAAKKKRPSGGGSGCVPLGSLIRTPDGWRAVESLGIGDAIVATRIDGGPSRGSDRDHGDCHGAQFALPASQHRLVCDTGAAGVHRAGLGDGVRVETGRSGSRRHRAMGARVGDHAGRWLFRGLRSDGLGRSTQLLGQRSAMPQQVTALGPPGHKRKYASGHRGWPVTRGPRVTVDDRGNSADIVSCDSSMA